MPTDALTTYLSQEISASDLSQLLDEHLHTMIRPPSGRSVVGGF